MRNETDVRSKALLAVGFLALTVAVLAAYTDPATGYELSVYRATPLAFWAGVGVATTVALYAAFAARSAAVRVLGLALGGSAYAATVGLPILRNYRYYGTADALTHLGWTRGIASGETGLLSLLYPGIHTFASFVAELTGYPTTRSMLYVVTLMAVLFVAFVALCAWLLTDDLHTAAVATFSGFMLLPITNISSQLVAHTTTQTLMFLPVPLYLLIRYLRSDSAGRFTPTAAGAVLATALVSLVLYHPQQALNLLLLFVAVAGLQFVVRRWKGTILAPDRPRTVYAQTGIFAVAFGLWTYGHARFQTSVSNTVVRLQDFVSGRAQVASETVQRGSSLSEVGSGLLEIFLKIFAVKAVYSLVAVAVLLATLAGVFAASDDEVLDSFNRYLVVGFVPVTALFVVYFVGSIGTQAFRHLGFLMVFATLLGAVGIGRAWRSLSGRVRGGAAGTAIAVFLLVALVASAATVFPSPWIYLHSQHVTDAQMTGYEAALEYTGDEAALLGVRGGPDRYADAVRGRTVDESRFGTLNETAMRSNLTAVYDDGAYFALTRLSYEREVVAYDQLRYSRRSFASARSQVGVDNVVDAGEFELYRVAP